jgi:hypothetical protein
VTYSQIKGKKYLFHFLFNATVKIIFYYLRKILVNLLCNNIRTRNEAHDQCDNKAQKTQHRQKSQPHKQQPFVLWNRESSFVDLDQTPTRIVKMANHQPLSTLHLLNSPHHHHYLHPAMTEDYEEFPNEFNTFQQPQRFQPAKIEIIQQQQHELPSLDHQQNLSSQNSQPHNPFYQKKF